MKLVHIQISGINNITIDIKIIALDLLTYQLQVLIYFQFCSIYSVCSIAQYRLYENNHNRTVDDNFNTLRDTYDCKIAVVRFIRNFCFKIVVSKTYEFREFAVIS